MMGKKWCYLKEESILVGKNMQSKLPVCSANGFFLVESLKKAVCSMIGESINGLDSILISATTKDEKVVKCFSLNDFNNYLRSCKEGTVDGMLVVVSYRLDKDDINEDYLTLFKLHLLYR